MHLKGDFPSRRSEEVSLAMVEKKKIPKKLTKGRASSAEVSTTKGSRTAILIVIPAEERKVGNSLLCFIGLIGGERLTC